MFGLFEGGNIIGGAYNGGDAASKLFKALGVFIIFAVIAVLVYIVYNVASGKSALSNPFNSV